MITITINTDGGAFDGRCGTEVRYLLQQAAHKLLERGLPGEQECIELIDINGNRCGELTTTGE